MMYRPKHLLEYGALRFISALVNLLPYRVALGFGWGLAWVGHRVVRFRAAEARRRIREVFGASKSDREIRRIAWISFRNLCFNVVEDMRVPRLTKAWIDRHMDTAEIDPALALNKSGKGVILAIPHSGNWDLAGAAAEMRGVPIFVIYAPQRNPLADRWLNRVRSKSGIETVSRESSVLKHVIRKLREGKALAFPTDLRSRTPGILVRFLGKTANVGAGMGVFARQANVPVFPAFLSRIGWTRHRWAFFEPIYPDETLPKEQDWQRMTQRVMDIYDRAIREQPEQYFWYNKRWILDPLDVSTSSPPSPNPTRPAAQSAR